MSISLYILQYILRHNKVRLHFLLYWNYQTGQILHYQIHIDQLEKLLSNRSLLNRYNLKKCIYSKNKLFKHTAIRILNFNWYNSNHQRLTSFNSYTSNNTKHFLYKEKRFTKLFRQCDNLVLNVIRKPFNEHWKLFVEETTEWKRKKFILAVSNFLF